MANRVYKESQSYRGTWIIYFTTWVEASMIVMLVVLYINGLDRQTMGLLTGIVVCTIGTIMTLFFKMKLETRIDKYGISFCYLYYTPNWEKRIMLQIKNREVIHYQPFLDYGGWGIKGNKTTKPYSVLGTGGLLLDEGEEKKTITGTMKPKKVKNVLENWMED